MWSMKWSEVSEVWKCKYMWSECSEVWVRSVKCEVWSVKCEMWECKCEKLWMWNVKKCWNMIWNVSMKYEKCENVRECEMKYEM
jgi:hypothetical protein